MSPERDLLPGPGEEVAEVSTLHLIAQSLGRNRDTILGDERAVDQADRLLPPVAVGGKMVEQQQRE